MNQYLDELIFNASGEALYDKVVIQKYQEEGLVGTLKLGTCPGSFAPEPMMNSTPSENPSPSVSLEVGLDCSNSSIESDSPSPSRSFGADPVRANPSKAGG